jgi:hypothetical protein
MLVLFTSFASLFKLENFLPAWRLPVLPVRYKETPLDGF